MKKGSLIFGASILLFACGTNAENHPTKEKKALKTETIKEEAQINPTTEDVLPEVKEIETTLEAVEDNSIKVEVEVAQNVSEYVKEEVQELEEIQEAVTVKVVEAMVARPDHMVWNGLLKANVTSKGNVNYKAMKSSIAKIESYLNHLKENSPKKDWNKNEKLAYWINLYNASTVYLIAKNYPTKSITNLSGGKPWDKKFVKSGEEVYSLNQIENEIVRPQFKEPRIHAALNCAAVSCPNLLNEAFVPGKLNNQLDKQTKVWINDISKNKLEPNKVKISQIFDWYKEDFKADGGVVAFINKYATSKVSPKAKVSYLEYNWGLNE